MSSCAHNTNKKTVKNVPLKRDPKVGCQLKKHNEIVQSRISDEKAGWEQKDLIDRFKSTYDRIHQRQSHKRSNASQDQNQQPIAPYGSSLFTNTSLGTHDDHSLYQYYPIL